MQCHLLHGSDIAGDLGEILEEDDLALVLRAEHRPNCLIQLMTQSVKTIKFEDGERTCLVSYTTARRCNPFCFLKPCQISTFYRCSSSATRNSFCFTI